MKKLSRTCANGVSLRNWVRRGMRAVKVLIFLSSLAGGGTTERDCDARPTSVRSTPGLVAVRAPRDRLRSSAAECSGDAVVSDAICRRPGHVGFIVCAPDPRAKFAAAVGELIFHPRGHLRVDRSRNNAGRLELAQTRGDHLRIRGAERTLYLGESTRTFAQGFDDVERPFAPYNGQCPRELIHFYLHYRVLLAICKYRTYGEAQKEGHL